MTRSKHVAVKSPSDEWATQWLESVASGTNTMSQRKLTSIEFRDGGLALVRRLAKKRGVHLVILTDDKGNELMAASTKPFKVIC